MNRVFLTWPYVFEIKASSTYSKAFKINHLAKHYDFLFWYCYDHLSIELLSIVNHLLKNGTPTTGRKPIKWHLNRCPAIKLFSGFLRLFLQQYVEVEYYQLLRSSPADHLGSFFARHSVYHDDADDVRKWGQDTWWPSSSKRWSHLKKCETCEINRPV